MKEWMASVYLSQIEHPNHLMIEGILSVGLDVAYDKQIKVRRKNT